MLFDRMHSHSSSFRRKIHQLGSLAIAFAAITTGAQVMTATADPGRLRAEIVYRDGFIIEKDDISNPSMRFESAVGRQSLDFSQIKRIVFGSEELENGFVETVAGDRWAAELNMRFLERRFSIYRDDEEDGIAAARVVFHREHPAVLPKTLQTQVTLNDGSIINVDGSRTILQMQHEYGTWPVPLASADAFSFAGDGESLLAAAWFRGEYLFLRGIVKDTTLTMYDRFGNTLDIPLRQVEKIVTQRPLTAVAGANTTNWRPHETALLRMRNERDDRATIIGATVWSLETAHGKLNIPSPLVKRVALDSDTRQTMVDTVCNERFVGKLDSGMLREWADDGKKAIRTFTSTAFEYLDYQRTTVNPSSDALTWRMVSGDVFYGRFVSPDITVEGQRRRGGDTVSSADIVSVTPHEETGVWTLETSKGQQLTLHSRERSVNVLLLVNGRQITLPWDAVESVRSTPIAELPPSISLPPGRNISRDAVYVEGNEFSMGRLRGDGMPNEAPPVTVRVASFIMDATPVTRAQFAAFVRDTNYRTDAEERGAAHHWSNPGFPQRDADPVVFVSWADAARFCNWRSRQAGLEPVYEFPRRNGTVITHRDRNGFRLPTETEWEYAARAGGRDIIYPWGDENDPETLAESANFQHSITDTVWPWTTPVKTYPPNALGLYDMAGNVWEWCEDWYYDQAYQTILRMQRFNPLVLADSVPELIHRVMRGGSFANAADMLRCASRGHGLPQRSANRVGFRTVRNAPTN